tara:strand:+ start:2578 stop:3069 length:492 start_codon:yes stop_codon:yes gene_type:complete
MNDIEQNQARKFANELAKLVSESFSNSKYPSQVFNVSYRFHEFDEPEDQEFDIHIRIPSIRPDLVNRKYKNNIDRNSACPAIERIMLPRWLQCQGFLTSLIDYLGNLPHVDAVCLSHVTNQSFSDYLESSDVWMKLESDYLPDSPMTKFHRNRAPTYCRIFCD